MSFGLAATDDDRIIGVGGHNFTYDTMTKVHILDTHAEKFQWQSLPDMPSRQSCFRWISLGRIQMELLDLV